MLSDNQESCTSPNSQEVGQTMSTNISPQPPSITAGNIAPGQFSIDMLFDEILLEIFACYVEESWMRDAWHTLAGVCRRWRSIVLGSPCRLNLRIICSKRTPVRENLDIWPPVPIVLAVGYHRNLGEDNIVATLEHHKRVCHIELWNISRSLWQRCLPLMQKPFPILTDLNLHYTSRKPLVIPDWFLGGSAPQLQKLNLECIPFPGLPKLLLSATDLVHLILDEIPDLGYISADAIGTCLVTLTRLELLRLCFELPHPHLESGRRRTSSSTRALLPALTYFAFKGVCEYLEDIVDRIDAPLLDRLRITFFNQPFDTPRLAHFINRVPKLTACNEARMCLGSSYASVEVLSISKTTTNASLWLEDQYGQRDVQLSPLVRLCTSSILQHFIPTVEAVVIFGNSFSRPPGYGGTHPDLWRDFLQPFTAVKDLYLSPEIAPRIASVLHWQALVGGSVLEFLPVLQNIFLKELQPPALVPEGIEQFIAARRSFVTHPISVSCWET